MDVRQYSYLMLLTMVSTNWEQEMNALDEGLEGQTARWANPELNTETWKNTRVPAYIEQSITPDLDGVIWFRKEIDLPKTWLNEDLKITLGPVDDEDICYFNGVPVGQTHGYNVERHYTVPKNLLREGPNVLTVRVNDTGGEGGIYGKADLLTAHNSIGSISLAGTWKYRTRSQRETSGNTGTAGQSLFNPKLSVPSFQCHDPSLDSLCHAGCDLVSGRS